MHDAASDAGVAHAGAAFAARRDELGISQRELAKMRIISAPALIAFEKGRSWPRDKTRAKLEQAVRWPPGTLAKLSAGQQAPINSAKEGAPDSSGTLLTGAVTMAAGAVFTAIDNLPDQDDPAFADRASATLADMRQLEALTARAVRSSQGSPEMIKLLREIRHRYDGVMSRAAAGAGATLGQRLYTARHAASLSVAEVAGAFDVAPNVVAAVESEQSISEEDRRRVEELIAALTG
ncbi:helix-turn-helix domain-containing protein (plasmid) [Mycolicibacterium aichiense]|uniref:helix-turn-helix domain-containing protein n=1 Tax=Mycolicibacterium aichiense TaxID=1799 RepID=UPI003D66E2F5